MKIVTVTTNEVRVCPEAVKGLPTHRSFGPYESDLKFTEEDLHHLKTCILEAQDRVGAISMPGVEHLYAKLHLVVRGELPLIEGEV